MGYAGYKVSDIKDYLNEVDTICLIKEIIRRRKKMIFINIKCSECNKKFRLTSDDFFDKNQNVITCPHCKYEEKVLT